MRRYKICDKKAPRFRLSKYRHTLITRELHDKFVKETNLKISFNEFKKIARLISEEIIDMVIEERDGILLPGQMGRLSLCLFKLKEKALNPLGSDIGGGEARYFSFETSGYQGKIRWDFNQCRYKVKNRELYGFTAHRNFKTLSSKSFLANPERYVKISQGEGQGVKNRKLIINEFNLKASIESGEGSEQSS